MKILFTWKSFITTAVAVILDKTKDVLILDQYLFFFQLLCLTFFLQDQGTLYKIIVNRLMCLFCMCLPSDNTKGTLNSLSSISSML